MRPALYFVMFCIWLLCLFCGCATQDDAATQVEVLTMVDLIQEDGTVQFPKVPSGTAREEFTQIFGVEYSAWGDAANSLVASGSIDEAPFLLEGRPAVVVFPLKDEKVRGILIYLLDDGADAAEWLSSSLRICDALEQASVSSSGFSRYEMKNAHVTIDWGPWDTAEYEDLGDGQFGWAGEQGVLGTRILHINIMFDS